MRSAKGIARQYRKAMKSKGIPFPPRGPFHVWGNGDLMPPSAVTREHTVIMGAFKPRSSPVNPMPAETLPELTAHDVTVFKRFERIGTSNGKEKKRVDYRPVKNPKSTERYYVKRTIDGKARYAEVEYGKLLAELSAAS